VNIIHSESYDIMMFFSCNL